MFNDFVFLGMTKQISYIK